MPKLFKDIHESKVAITMVASTRVGNTYPSMVLFTIIGMKFKVSYRLLRNTTQWRISLLNQIFSTKLNGQ
jgi:hypothetical protein